MLALAPAMHVAEDMLGALKWSASAALLLDTAICTLPLDGTGLESLRWGSSPAITYPSAAPAARKSAVHQRADLTILRRSC